MANLQQIADIVDIALVRSGQSTDASMSVTMPGRGSPTVAGNQPRPACQEASGGHRAGRAARYGRARVCSAEARGRPESAAGYRGQWGNGEGG